MKIRDLFLFAPDGVAEAGEAPAAAPTSVPAGTTVVTAPALVVERMPESRSMVDNNTNAEKGDDDGDETSRSMTETIQRAIRDGVNAEVKRALASVPKPAPAVDTVPAEARRFTTRSFKDAETAHSFGCWLIHQVASVRGGESLIGRGVAEGARRHLASRGLLSRATMTTATPDGAVMIPETFVGSLFDLALMPSVVQRVGQQVPMVSGQGRGYYPSRRTALGTVVDTSTVEADDTITISNPNNVPVDLNARRIRGGSKFSRELDLDTAGLIGDRCARELMDARNRAIDYIVFASSVTRGIRGLGKALTDASALTQISGGATISAITRANLNRLKDAVFSNREAAAAIQTLRWVITPAAFSQLKDLDNVLTVTGSSVAVNDTQSMRLLGFPVEIAHEMEGNPGASPAYTHPVYFGAFQYSLFWGELRNALSIEVNPWVYQPTGEIGVFLFDRIALDVVNVGDSTAYGPVGGIKLTGV